MRTILALILALTVLVACSGPDPTSTPRRYDYSQAATPTPTMSHAEQSFVVYVETGAMVIEDGFISEADCILMDDMAGVVARQHDRLSTRTLSRFKALLVTQDNACAIYGASSAPVIVSNAVPTPTPRATATPRPLRCERCEFKGATATPTLRPTPIPTATPTPTLIPTATPTPGPAPTPTWVEQCIASRTEGLNPNRRADEYYFTKADLLCTGQHKGQERGLVDEELNRWMNDFARASALGLPRGSPNGTVVPAKIWAEWIADARWDFRQRCEHDADAGYLVGPFDFYIYAERVAETSLEAAERYLPCTLHQNGEIQAARRAGNQGLRWEAPDGG